MKVIYVDEKPFIVQSDNRFKCECGKILKNESNLSKHLTRKSHFDEIEWRKQHGNTIIHTSLLVKGLVLYR
jgi:hypothetical protein